MRYLNKAFPHPVLRPDIDDYTESGFQCTCTPALLSEGSRSVAIDVEFMLSSPEIKDLVNNGQAVCAVDIYCADTMYRKGFRASGDRQLIFDSDELYGKVEAQGVVIAVSEVEDFTAADFNPEFNNRSFQLTAGDLLAFDFPESFYVDFERLAFESLIRVETSAELDSLVYSIDLHSDMISIRMGFDMRKVWDEMQDRSPSSSLLAMAVYKDCVFAALWGLRAMDEETTSFRWARALQKKLNDLEVYLSPDMDIDKVNVLAQNLVENIGAKKVLKDVN